MPGREHGTAGHEIFVRGAPPRRRFDGCQNPLSPGGRWSGPTGRALACNFRVTVVFRSDLLGGSLVKGWPPPSPCPLPPGGGALALFKAVSSSSSSRGTHASRGSGPRQLQRGQHCATQGENHDTVSHRKMARARPPSPLADPVRWMDPIRQVDGRAPLPLSVAPRGERALPHIAAGIETTEGEAVNSTKRKTPSPGGGWAPFYALYARRRPKPSPADRHRRDGGRYRNGQPALFIWRRGEERSSHAGPTRMALSG